MKTLLVHYAPTGETSFTAKMVAVLKDKLINRFAELGGGLEVIERDLVMTPPPLFSTQSMQGYVTRNYRQEEVTAEQVQALRPFDELMEELKVNDLLVLAFPMYNFSVPAAIKAWLDAVAQAKSTFRYGNYGPEGLLTGKKALILMSTGNTPETSPRNYATPLIKEVLRFMGITDIKVIGLYQSRNTAMLPDYWQKFSEELEEYLETTI